MKNRLNTHWLVIVGISSLFMLTSFAAGYTPQVSQTSSNNAPTITFTHAVFAEDATATWCGYCHYARAALDKIYTAHDYPFYYVCLVDDMDTHSHARIGVFNLYGFPTVFFDGGNQVVVGGWTGAEAAYRSAIQATGARTVSKIDVNLNVNWLGNAAMDITASVKNNEASTYTGHIRVYVTECNSSMGWKDTTGHVYTFPLLDFAMDQGISVNSADTWTNEVSWDGHNYNDGHGHNFGSIQAGNIEVIAVVFNSQSHQGYSKPPSGYPFTAYWVDNATGVLVGGAPPDAPNTPPAPSGPYSGLVNVGYNFTALTTDPQNDPLYYYFDFGDGTNSGWVGPYNPGVSGTANHAWTHGGSFNVKVKAKDTGSHESAYSPTHGITITAPTVTVTVKAVSGIVEANVTNPSAQELTSLDWNILIKGGLIGLVNKNTNGTIDSIPAGASTTIQSARAFGLGSVKVTVTVESITVDKQGFILGPFVFLR